MDASRRLSFDRGDAQSLLHDRTRGGVLQELAFLRKQVVLNPERSERSFVKTAQDELFLARVRVDIADCKNTRHAGLKVLGADLERFLFQFQPPLGDWPEFGVQS